MAPRFHIAPGDVPDSVIARHLGLTLEAFKAVLPNLIARGFPEPDPDTGNCDFDAVCVWRRLRHSHLYNNRGEFGPRDASSVVQDRIAALRSKSA